VAAALPAEIDFLRAVTEAPAVLVVPDAAVALAAAVAVTQVRFRLVAPAVAAAVLPVLLLLLEENLSVQAVPVAEVPATIPEVAYRTLLAVTGVIMAAVAVLAQVLGFPRFRLIISVAVAAVAAVRVVVQTPPAAPAYS
jgi:hypothetical protein